MSDFPYLWMRSQRPKGRRGQACRKVPRDDPRRARALAGLEHVEFEDGSRFLVDRRGLVKIPGDGGQG